MSISKLMTGAQFTIPQSVRTALRVQAGDELLYALIDERFILTKVNRGGKTDDPSRTFSDRKSAADVRAYGKL